ncbi:MAG: DoxX family membrane protein [Maribacter dokdonensis]|nr:MULTISPECIES: DoxX family membrane protein [Maribacter]MDP2526715.1 DoxX family membrane protein [Maribacter dokdonensis]HAF77337.1 DoxX family membrane protein [Maribacter sp.]HAI42597.1 DoxX family membrane protein [Maribacter sp.]|tara:strand:+ start:1328 stop:1726 length:399 start_codon:yes stop_codon:yes gene_type:complete
MEILMNNATEVLLLLFLIITFLQSGFDKITDWNGNVSWLKEHFSKTPFKNSVPLLVGIILVTEVIAGLLCVIGIYQILSSGNTTFAMYGAVLSSITLLMLLFGQRVAKDYEGAKTIAVYFIPTILLVFLLQS